MDLIASEFTGPRWEEPARGIAKSRLNLIRGGTSSLCDPRILVCAASQFAQLMCRVLQVGSPSKDGNNYNLK